VAIFRFIALAILVVTFARCDAASAQTRRAFVVGIDVYRNLAKAGQLERAVNDAKAVAVTLGRLGFKVTTETNLDRAAFNGRWQEFLDTIQKDDVVTVYFAGHGIEIETQNFLLPADIPLIKWGRDSQLRREAISLAEMMIDLKARKPGLSVVILDACRNNPFLPEGGRNLGPGRGGLNSAQAAPNGVFILYSAGAGETALDRLDGDGEEKNSVYTRRLLPLMTTEGLTLGELARRVREDVSLLAASNSHPQTPAYYDGVVGDFCFAGCRVPQPQAAPRDEERELWEAYRKSRDILDVRLYLRRYPHGAHRADAQAALVAHERRVQLAAEARELERAEELAWARASSADQMNAYADYKRAYPQGRHVGEADRRIAALAARERESEAAAQQREAARQDELDWARASSADQPEAYEAYLRQHASGAHADEARARIDELKRLAAEWKTIETGQSFDALAAFIGRAGRSQIAAVAQSRLALLERREAEAFERAEQDRLLEGYRRFAKDWPDGPHHDNARQRIAELEAIEREWAGLRTSEDVVKLEAFIARHGWSEFGALATERVIGIKRGQAPARPDEAVAILGADALLAEIDRKTLTLVGDGGTIAFDTKAKPAFRGKLEAGFWKAVNLGFIKHKGVFVAEAKVGKAKRRFEGLAGIVESGVDKSSYLFLMQIVGNEKSVADIDRKDRLFATVQIAKDPHGLTCIGTRWASLLGEKEPEKITGRCEVGNAPR
jgi:hypothetical protein